MQEHNCLQRLACLRKFEQVSNTFSCHPSLYIIIILYYIYQFLKLTFGISQNFLPLACVHSLNRSNDHAIILNCSVRFKVHRRFRRRFRVQPIKVDDSSRRETQLIRDGDLPVLRVPTPSQGKRRMHRARREERRGGTRTMFRYAPHALFTRRNFASENRFTISRL